MDALGMQFEKGSSLLKAWKLTFNFRERAES
jgi:hypothetical protein